MKKNAFPKMHVSLYVKDLEKTINFYNVFFGQKPEKVKHGYTKYILDEPALIISFIESPSKAKPHFGHLGFQVASKEEMERRMAIAESFDLVRKKEIGTSCCYAVQDKFWVNDPDGVQWEVYFFHQDTEFNDPHYKITTDSACRTESQSSSCETDKAKDAQQIIAEASCC